MAGKMKHKSRSRVTYRARMNEARTYLNNYSIGKAKTKKKMGGFVGELLEQVKKIMGKQRRQKAPRKKQSERKKEA